jgi:hypothetical protein
MLRELNHKLTQLSVLLHRDAPARPLLVASGGRSLPMAIDSKPISNLALHTYRPMYMNYMIEVICPTYLSPSYLPITVTGMERRR